MTLYSELSHILRRTLRGRSAFKLVVNKSSLNFDYVLYQFDSSETVSWIQLDGFKSVPGLGITRGRLRVSGQADQLYIQLNV